MRRIKVAAVLAALLMADVLVFFCGRDTFLARDFLFYGMPLGVICFPIGMLLFVAIVALISQEFQDRAHRADDYSRCPRCFYDLTGNASGVCPECGTKIGPRSGPDRCD